MIGVGSNRPNGSQPIWVYFQVMLASSNLTGWQLMKVMQRDALQWLCRLSHTYKIAPVSILTPPPPSTKWDMRLYGKQRIMTSISGPSKGTVTTRHGGDFLGHIQTRRDFIHRRLVLGRAFWPGVGIVMSVFLELYSPCSLIPSVQTHIPSPHSLAPPYALSPSHVLFSLPMSPHAIFFPHVPLLCPTPSHVLSSLPILLPMHYPPFPCPFSCPIPSPCSIPHAHTLHCLFSCHIPSPCPYPPLSLLHAISHPHTI